MSNVETHAAEIASTSLHPEAAIRLARALSAISAEFDAVMAEGIDRLRHLREALEAEDSGAGLNADLRQAVEAARRDGNHLGHPMISDIAASLATILDAWRGATLPLDIIDAHIETMDAVLTDAGLKPGDAAAQVADLAAAAADYVAAARHD